MRLRQLRILLAIVDNGLNITAAAESLYTSQPGVSKQLKLLEEELGFKVFTRKGRSLESLTPQGEEILRRARVIMSEVRAIQAISDRAYDQTDGTLAIGTTHTQARYVLPDVIAGFRDRYPGIRLDLHQGTTEQIAEMAESGQIDFAIATGSEDRFPDWVLLPCYRWDRNIVVPADHPLATVDRPITLQDLAAHPLVTYVFSSRGESSLMRAFADAGLQADVAFTARDADVIKTYVRMGLGVGIIASMACAAGEEGLVALDGAGLFPRCTTWLGFSRDLLWRRYMFEFIEQFAPAWTPEMIREALGAPSAEAVWGLLSAGSLPLKGPAREIPPGPPAPEAP